MANEIKVGISLVINHPDGAQLVRSEAFEITMASGKKFIHDIVELAGGVYEDISPFSTVALLFVKSLVGTTVVGFGEEEENLVIAEGRSSLVVVPFAAAPGNVYLSSSVASTAEYIIVEA